MFTAAGNETKEDIAVTAKIVHDDLCKGRRWQNVEYRILQESRKVVLCGQADNESEHKHVIPVELDEDLSMTKLDKLLRELNSSSNSATLAIVGNDTSVVYYHVSLGLLPPRSAVSDKESKHLLTQSNFSQTFTHVAAPGEKPTAQTGNSCKDSSVADAELVIVEDFSDKCDDKHTDDLAEVEVNVDRTDSNSPTCKKRKRRRPRRDRNSQDLDSSENIDVIDISETWGSEGWD